jgi:hypothetical protein
MRLNKNINIKLFFLFFIMFFLKGTSTVQACLCGELCRNCPEATFTSSAWFSCPGGQGIRITCEDNAGASGSYVVGTTGTYWNPSGNSTTICKNTCDPLTTVNKVVECYNYIGVCENSVPTATPNTGNPEGGPAAPLTVPSGPILPGDVPISGSINLDVNAAASGSYCSQSASSPLAIAGLSMFGISSTYTYSPTMTESDYSINMEYAGNNYTVALDLSGQTGGDNYVCSCPAAADPNNPYYCSYSGVTAPGNNVNFYVKKYNLSSDSWFQVFGGNLFAKTNVNSPVPYSFCLADGNCQAALLVPQAGSTNKTSSGFPISNTDSSNNIISNASSTFYHSYFNLADRPSNVNSYGVSTDLAQLSYDYFYKLAENSVQQIGNGEVFEPLFSDWTSSAWWSANDINYVRINGDVVIAETQGFNLTSSQKLIVFVDGDLTINDTNPNDTNLKITSVDKGGFLAFFVTGNISITPSVGYELFPSVPTVPAVSTANSNLEGVFIADGTLTIMSKLAVGIAPPDKKFIGSGTFIGWTGVNLDRTFNDGASGPILNNNQAIENFIYRPDFLANWPTKLKASVSNWREVDPQLVQQ